MPVASRRCPDAVRLARNRLVGSLVALPRRGVRVRVVDVKVTDSWFSERLEQPIGLARWGHYGTPVLVFPTAGGDAEEIERNGVIGALWPMIEAGRIKVYSCDSVAGRAMGAKTGSSRDPEGVGEQVPPPRPP